VSCIGCCNGCDAFLGVQRQHALQQLHIPPPLPQLTHENNVLLTNKQSALPVVPFQAHTAED
jgi:hypothetical protein